MSYVHVYIICNSLSLSLSRLKDSQRDNTRLQKDLNECREKCDLSESRLNAALADKRASQQRVSLNRHDSKLHMNIYIYTQSGIGCSQ